jgi:hypothetical protein
MNITKTRDESAHDKDPELPLKPYATWAVAPTDYATPGFGRIDAVHSNLHPAPTLRHERKRTPCDHCISKRVAR